MPGCRGGRPAGSGGSHFSRVTQSRIVWAADRAQMTGQNGRALRLQQRPAACAPDKLSA